MNEFDGPTLVMYHTAEIKAFAEKHPKAFLLVSFVNGDLKEIRVFDDLVASEYLEHVTNPTLRESMEDASKQVPENSIILTFFTARQLSDVSWEIGYGTMSCCSIEPTPEDLINTRFCGTA